MDNVTLQTQQAQIDQLIKTNELLMKAIPKARLARHMPQEAFGQEIKISTYRLNENDEPRLVVGWSLIKDYVRTTKKLGVVEDQIVEIQLDGDMKSLNFLNARLKKLTDPEKIKETEKEIEEARSGNYVKMSLVNFDKDLEKVAVKVDTDKTIYAKDGDPKEYFFTWNGEEKSLLAPFIN